MKTRLLLLAVARAILLPPATSLLLLAVVLVPFHAPIVARFVNQSGLTLHTRKMHSASYHSKKTTYVLNVVHPKKRWTKIEVDTMAKAEADFVYNHPEVQNINQHLLSILEGRTLEGIKGKRKDARYKQLVNDLLAEKRDQSISNDPLSPIRETVSNLSVKMPNLSPVSTALHESIDTMPVLVSGDAIEGTVEFYIEKLNK